MEWYAKSAARAPKGIPKANTDGDCYEVSGKYLMDNGMYGRNPDLVLVHGIVHGQGKIKGIPYGHAWVEDGGEVIDRSNGRDLRLPKELYYALGGISETRRYSISDMRKKVNEHEHWGPWDVISEY